MPHDVVFIRDRLILDPSAGVVEIVYHAKPILKGATAEVTYQVRGKSKSLSLSEGGVAYGVARDKISLSRSDGQVQLEWYILVPPSPGNELSMWLQVTNTGQEPVQVDELHVLAVDVARGGTVELGSRPQDWSFYQNGWQSWSPAFARHVADGLYIDPATEDYKTKHQPHPLPVRPKTLSSEWFTVISPRSKVQSPKSALDLGPRTSDPSLLLGFITTKDQLAEIRLQANARSFHRLTATCYADGLTLQPGEHLASEQLLLAFGDDALGLLDHYGARLGEMKKARQIERPPTGWCTWYYFYGQNTEKDVLDNLAGIKGEQLPLDYILVDDGYQRAIGDWLDIDEARFPHGMKWLAEQIKAAGQKPALWIIPFAVGSDSHLYAAHPDWVIRDERGEPIVAWRHRGIIEAYGLDLTNTEVQEWLRSVFRIMSDEWGYEFFKIDFVYAAALASQYHDPKMTRAQALRKGLEIIREAIGDKFLLGCGAPLGPAVGLVDGMRIGTDVAVAWKPFWRDLSFPATENALRNVVARSFLHGKLWLNDPDCVMVRTRDDESDLVLNEMRTLISLVGLSGGLVLSGDNFPTLRRGRLKYLKQILPPYGTAAILLDLFEKEMPNLFVLPVQRDFGQWLVAAVINWGDRTVETTIDLTQLGLPPDEGYHVYNYWRRRYLGLVRDRLTIARHQPHCTALLLLKPVSDQPQFLTSTFHITQGGVEVKSVQRQATSDKRQRLILELEKAGIQFGQLLFAVPQPWRVVEARVDGRLRGVNQVAQGVVGIGFTLEDQAIVELEFRT